MGSNLKGLADNARSDWLLSRQDFLVMAGHYENVSLLDASFELPVKVIKLTRDLDVIIKKDKKISHCQRNCVLWFRPRMTSIACKRMWKITCGDFIHCF